MNIINQTIITSLLIISAIYLIFLNMTVIEKFCIGGVVGTDCRTTTQNEIQDITKDLTSIDNSVNKVIQQSCVQKQVASNTLHISGSTINNTNISQQNIIKNVCSLQSIFQSDIKSKTQDEIAATEAYASEFVRGTEREQLYHTDGTSFWDNYVDRSYMVSGYAGVFIPQIDFSKPLDEPVTTDDALAIAMLFERNFSDNANVTDDFDGDISSEDDQTMRFAKGLSDLARSSIIVNRDMTKPLSDSSTASEALARLTEKKLSDISSFSDIISTYNVKRLDDVFTTSDGIEKFDIEKLLNDTADATDDFDGVATAEDDQTMSFVTSRTETFSVGDSASPAAGKNLTESVSTSDSGSLRKTDYCDVLYFADVYVGTSATF